MNWTIKLVCVSVHVNRVMAGNVLIVFCCHIVHTFAASSIKDIWTYSDILGTIGAALFRDLLQRDAKGSNVLILF